MGQRFSNRRAAASNQYALVVGLIAIVAIAAVAGLGAGVSLMLDRVSNRLSNGSSGSSSSGGGGSSDTTPPALQSLTRSNPTGSATSADTLIFLATFSESVTGLNGTDFTVTGTSGTVTAIAGGPAAYMLTVSGGNLHYYNGTVGLQLAAGHGIADTAGNALPDTQPPLTETYSLSNGMPTCASLSAPGDVGVACDFSGARMVLAGNTLAGAARTPTPFFAAQCDLGQSWNSGSNQCECNSGTITETGQNINQVGDDANNGVCNGAITFDRSNYPWNDGSSNLLDSPLDDCTNSTCSSVNVDGSAEAWDVGWDGQANTLDGAVGLINTDAATTTGGTDPHLAAIACSNLGTGWYLPSLNELTLLYSVRATGAFANTFDTSGTMPHSRYWTSSDSSTNVDAYFVNFGTGTPGVNNNWGTSVRCARR